MRNNTPLSRERVSCPVLSCVINWYEALSSCFDVLRNGTENCEGRPLIKSSPKDLLLRNNVYDR